MAQDRRFELSNWTLSGEVSNVASLLVSSMKGRVSTKRRLTVGPRAGRVSNSLSLVAGLRKYTVSHKERLVVSPPFVCSVHLALIKLTYGGKPQL